jgi:hypothetical protein
MGKQRRLNEKFAYETIRSVLLLSADTEARSLPAWRPYKLEVQVKFIDGVPNKINMTDMKRVQ